MSNHNSASSRVVPRGVQIVMSLLLSITAMTVLVPDPASADPEHGLRNVSTQLCLTSDPFTIGHHGISTEPCVYSLQQRWHHHAGTYAYRVMNYSIGVCLDSNTRGEVYGNPCTANNSFQEWIITSNQYGDRLQNLATRRCLDSNTSGDVYTLACNEGNFQRWRTR